MPNVASNTSAWRGAKWGKFSEQDLSALKGNDDLVTQLAAKYSLEKAQAQRDVDALLKGRRDLTRAHMKPEIAVRGGLAFPLQDKFDVVGNGRPEWPRSTTAPWRNCFPPGARRSCFRLEAGGAGEPVGYGRFARAADAIRFAIEELPPELLPDACLEVDEEIFEREEVRRLYESDAYPLARRAATVSVREMSNDTSELKEIPMKFRPLHDRVVVKRIDAEAKSAGGIIIPDTAKEKPSQGGSQERDLWSKIIVQRAIPAIPGMGIGFGQSIDAGLPPRRRIDVKAVTASPGHLRRIARCGSMSRCGSHC